MNKTAVVILALALASSAYGMVFSWTDSAGIKHFTNKRDEIPERYRAKAKPLYPEQADMLPGQQNTQPQPVKPEVPPAVQPAIPAEPPKTPQPVAAPEPPKKEIAPVTGRKDRRRPLHREDE
jgi:outer membrane biosynthesis protein TonB